MTFSLDTPESNFIYGYEGDDKIYSVSGHSLGQEDYISAGSGADTVRVKLQDEFGVSPVNVNERTGNDLIEIEGTGAGTVHSNGLAATNSDGIRA